jgi:multiple sugar transport system permease protein
VSQVTAHARRLPVQTRRQDRRPAAVRRLARLHRAARWAFLAPAVAYVLFAFAIPVLYNLLRSVEQTTPATISHLTAPFAGLSNYTTALRDPVADSAIVRTFSFTVLSLLLQFLIGFGLALLFNLRFPLRTLARSLILVPWLLPLLVTGVIFKFLFQLQAGAVNQILLDLHLVHQPVGFEVSSGWAYLTVLITNVWIGVPFFTVLLYSALQDVPAELIEAARCVPGPPEPVGHISIKRAIREAAGRPAD